MEDIEVPQQAPSILVTPQRQYREKKAIVFLSVFFITAAYQLNPLEMVLSNSLWFCIFFFIELLRRVAYCTEEYLHLESRYDGSLAELFRKAFTLNKKTVFTLVITFSVLLIHYTANMNNSSDSFVNIFRTVYTMGMLKITISVIVVTLFQEIVHMDESDLKVSRKIQDMNGLDYGSGMAHSYVNGYLQIILPEQEFADRPYLRQSMRNYEDAQGITFAVDKMIILVPKSLRCPPKVPGDNEIEIEACAPLESVNLNRAGVQDRVYKNTVYKIYDNRNPENRNRTFYYVCCEYATPCKTLDEVINQNSTYANVYKEHKNDLVTQFYVTLNDLLKSRPDIGNSCSLIYFQDNDENGRPVNVGAKIIDRIHEIQNGIA